MEGACIIVHENGNGLVFFFHHLFFLIFVLRPAPSTLKVLSSVAAHFSYLASSAAWLLPPPRAGTQCTFLPVTGNMCGADTWPYLRRGKACCNAAIVKNVASEFLNP